jgi:thiamine transport system permease protein
MALCNEPIAVQRRFDVRIAAGTLALAAVIVLAGGAILGLVAEAGRNWSGAAAAFDSYMLRVARFTLLQAILSTLLSVGPAIFVARALSRHPDFPGRAIVLRLFAVPLALPAIVAALGVLALYGRAGYFAEILSVFAAGRWPGIYGLSGIVVAHVFFNLPLATRLFVHALETIPPDQWRLASQLGMRPSASFRLIEWPAIRANLAGVASLVFMLCVTSFTTVLILGGGPRATTLEVAIYQALRFDFDPARAVALTAIQIVLTAAMVVVLARMGRDLTGDASLPVASRRHLRPGPGEAIANTVLILAASLFVVGPMAATAMAGLAADLGRLVLETAVLKATATSLVLASFAALLAVLVSTALVGARRALELARRGGRATVLERATDTGAGFILVLPPIVIGAGWFVLLRNFADVFLLAPVMVVTVNAAMAMPFVVRAIRPAHDAASERHERLCGQLGIAGFARFRLIDWPALKRPMMTGFAFAMALSLGDLGVIALFGSDAVQTLPFLLLGRMASYRTADAAGLALVLGALCLTLMFFAESFGRRHA